MKLTFTLFLSVGVSLTQAVDTTIPVTATTNGLTTLVTALKAANLATTLSGDGPFTVFAPTNDAFAMVDEGVLECLLDADNKAVLSDVLLYHVASGKVTSDMLSNNQEVESLQGSDATVTISSGVVKINGATVTAADVSATNGVVHVIDQVLLPTNNDDLDKLVKKCGKTSASAVLGVTIPLIGMLAAAVAVIV